METHTITQLWNPGWASPGTPPRAKSPSHWAAWHLRTRPCITVQETQWGEVSVSPDKNLSAWAPRTSRGRSGPTTFWTAPRSRCPGGVGRELVFESGFLVPLSDSLETSFVSSLFHYCGLYWFHNTIHRFYFLFKYSCLFVYICLCGICTNTHM